MTPSSITLTNASWTSTTTIPCGKVVSSTQAQVWLQQCNTLLQHPHLTDQSSFSLCTKDIHRHGFLPTRYPCLGSAPCQGTPPHLDLDTQGWPMGWHYPDCPYGPHTLLQRQSQGSQVVSLHFPPFQRLPQQVCPYCRGQGCLPPGPCLPEQYAVAHQCTAATLWSHPTHPQTRTQSPSHPSQPTHW